MLRSRWSRAVVALLFVALAATLPSTSTAAVSGPGSVRMLSVLSRVDAARFTGDNHLYVSPGVYIASTNGPFEIDAVRASDGTVSLWQVQRDWRGVRIVRRVNTPAPAHLGIGLPRFLDLVLRDAKGNVLTSRYSPFCPSAGFGLSRADASGPDHPTYPFDCGGPMSEAAVWGIDRGWASELSLTLPFKSPDGTYTLDVAIDPYYAGQLGIAPADSHASVQLKVTTTSGGPCPPGPGPCGFASAARAAADAGASARTEGPSAGQLALAQGGDNGRLGTGGVPDMRALPAHDLSITHVPLRHQIHDYLNFGATIWNAGTGPLVVEGFRTGQAEVMPATQFIYRNGRPASSQQIGHFEFDHRPGHNHWHMEDIAQYDLLDASGNRVVLSDKQSFCLAPTDAINLALPGADWQPDQAALWSACSGEDAIWLREVLPAGWGDTYYQSVAGQSFDITALLNGNYQIRVTADPLNHLVETNHTNNVGLLAIVLGGTPGHRTVKIG
jgi:hypothetical protein